jgi:hypothetical protein
MRSTATDTPAATADAPTVTTLGWPGMSWRYVKLKRNPVIASPMSTGVDRALLLPKRLLRRSAGNLITIR